MEHWLEIDERVREANELRRDVMKFPDGMPDTRVDGPPQACRPGTELKRLLSKFGFKADEKGCKCGTHAAQMDAWGCDKCAERVDEIVGWLAIEAAKRKLPFSHTLAGVLVRRAIANARRAAAR